MRSYRIAVVPGDGIGREVTPAALEVLEAAGQRYGFRLEPTEYAWGCDYFVEHGRMMAPDGLERLRDSDAILLGAVGRAGRARPRLAVGAADPDPAHVPPVREPATGPAVAGARVARCATPTPETVDMVIVRENVEGEYSEIGGRIYRNTDDELAIQEAVFTRRGTDRGSPLRVRAGRPPRRPHLLRHEVERDHPHDAVLGRASSRSATSQHPDVQAEQVLIDALAAPLVLQPARFDVIVASNLFGDILVRPRGRGRRLDRHRAVRPTSTPSATPRRCSSPSTGRRPTSPGQGVANPVGAIWSAAMMLEHLGEPDASHAVEGAIGAAIAQGPPARQTSAARRTTAEVTAAVVAAI